MSRVDVVEFINDKGERVEEEDIEQMWRMESIHVIFDCPICSDTVDTEIEAPLQKDLKFRCPHCKESYFMYPRMTTTNHLVRELDTKQKIELQLKSVSTVHSTADKYPMLTVKLAESPKTAIMGILATGAGFVFMPVYFVKLLDRLLALEPFFTATMGLYVLTMVFAMIALMDGPLGTLYYNYIAYRREGYVISFYDYVVYMGNYYHGKPFFIL